MDKSILHIAAVELAADNKDQRKLDHLRDFLAKHEAGKETFDCLNYVQAAVALKRQFAGHVLQHGKETT